MRIILTTIFTCLCVFVFSQSKTIELKPFDSITNIKPRIIKNKKTGYFTIHYQFIVGSKSQLTAGSGIKLEHFPYSKGILDLGYNIGYDWEWMGTGYHNLNANFIGLIGKGAAQLEFFTGVNYILPTKRYISDEKFNNLSFIDFFNSGLGIRLSSYKFPGFFRLGSSTTAWAYIGTGFTFGTTKNKDSKSILSHHKKMRSPKYQKERRHLKKRQRSSQSDL